MNFQEWYRNLRKLMRGKACNEGMHLDPDEWCDLEAWRELYDLKMTPAQAFMNER